MDNELEEVRKALKIAEARALNEQQLRQEEQRLREAAERDAELERQKTRETTLPEFLDACHVNLFSGLKIQRDSTMSTQGKAANAKDKKRSNHIRFWEEFPYCQKDVWEDLMSSDFVFERHFTSSHTLRETGARIHERLLGSELDLHHFARSTIEDHVSFIVRKLSENAKLRTQFRLKGSIKFENHANTLSPDGQLEEGIDGMDISDSPHVQLRRSPRLLAQSTQTSYQTTTAARTRSRRPRADQFCVYSTPGESQNLESRVAAFIIEYKAPHKLTLGHIYEGLEDMDLEEVVQEGENETSREQCRRLVAAAITQAFSYMISAGLEYGYVCTGEAFIFLRVPEDPTTVQYFLSVPGNDVGEATGLASESDGDNRLHLTAVAQVLAFTLQALKVSRRGQEWFQSVNQLKTWEITYEQVLESLPELDVESSEYRPPAQRTKAYHRMSPVRLRRPKARSTSASACSESVVPRDPDEEGPPDEDSPIPPSRGAARRMVRALPAQATHRSSPDRSTKQEGKSREYCTQGCLRGLVEGGILDRSCPNLQDHGTDAHAISQSRFISLIQLQLSNDLDTNVEPIGIQGARSAFFKITLTSHGYTVAAKCTPTNLISHLLHEAKVYERLRPVQGLHVPVYLGNIDLERPYHYDGIAELTHMMFLSFGGPLIQHHVNSGNRLDVIEATKRSLQAVHDLGVVHNDIGCRNILWNTEIGRVMIIDFDRAEFQTVRAALGTISPNRKRKREVSQQRTKGNGHRADTDAFAREIRRIKFELGG